MVRDRVPYRLEVVSRVELGAITAPGGLLDDAVRIARLLGGHAQNDALADPHHHVPSDDFNTVGRELVVPACLLQVLVYLIDRLRLVVPQEERQQEGARLRYGGARLGRCLGRRRRWMSCRAQGGEEYGRRS